MSMTTIPEIQPSLNYLQCGCYRRKF